MDTSVVTAQGNETKIYILYQVSQGQTSDLRLSLHLTHAKKCVSRLCRFIVNNLKLVHTYQLQKYYLTDLNEMANDSLKVEILERLANE